MSSTKCPHCQVIVHFETYSTSLKKDVEGEWTLTHTVCPSCNKLVAFLSIGVIQDINQNDPFPPLPLIVTGVGQKPLAPKLSGPFLVWPKHASFTPAPTEVPQKLADDYNEARTILDLSPKASAALARRCLQSLIRDYEGITERDLSTEIQKLLNSGKLPSYLATEPKISKWATEQISMRYLN